MAKRPTLEYLKTEAASGSALALAAAAALVWANSPWAEAYFDFVKHPLTIQVGAFEETKTVLKWIKDGLMAVFFFVVGMEIKYEVMRGELSNPRKLALPVFAALGGMIAPALIYLSLNLGPGGQPSGWAIPTATDIAFALAALAIAAPKAPPALRVFLLTLAIADDLGAVALIAVLFTSEIDWVLLAAAIGTVGAMALLGLWKRAPVTFYALLALAAWALTLESGVNTSLAAVAAAMTIPVGASRPGEEGRLKGLMHDLHPYVAWGILPLFAFAAAGFSFAAMSPSDLVAPLPLGVLLGLVLGKPLGVAGAALLAVGLKLAQKPTDSTWLQVLGVSMLCGVGFTMSLFIGGLAFPGGGQGAQVQLGVVAGSLISILLGAVTLALAPRKTAVLEPASE
ncbi:MAG TPA: Na+/H+ antiporter NhaA [Caulobacter sp.]|nr:Na+/H+ antiporter NhaA [Caulobacter sp.]